MPVLEVNGRSYEVDEDGFLMDPEIWNEEVAKDFATTENVFDMTRRSLEAGALHSQIL